MEAALYLAHLNPVTKAHESIISRLKRDYNVYVFPVRFLKAGREINTKSFPFSFEQRKEMVEAVFGNSVNVLPDYTFHAPFSKYMPPLLSGKSWELRNQIVSHVAEEKFVSYTGDKAERLMLKVYRLNPLKADRLEISASSVKEMMYREAVEERRQGWRDLVPEPVVKVIEKNWEIVERFARAEDATRRIMGMKFPQQGYQ
jgi:nicotinic acid mononucleotide adenylyltransferase